MGAFFIDNPDSLNFPAIPNFIFLVLISHSIRLVLLFLGLLATIFVYFPGLSGPFLFDDSHVFKSNALVKISTLDPQSLVSAMESFSAGGRQLSMLSFALNHYFFGASSWWLKFVNVLIHCLNGIGLYCLLTQLMNKTSPTRGISEKFDIRLNLPLGVTLLWLLHPINLTSVLYISQRMALLSSFFIIYGLVTYVWARHSISSTSRKLLYFPLIIGTFTILGYLSKENGVLLPGFILILEIVILKFQYEGKPDKALIGLFLVGATGASILVGYQFWSNPHWLTAGYYKRPFTMDERLLTQCRALFLYISQIIVPSVSRFALWHDDFKISTGWLVPMTTAWSAVGILGLVVAGFALILKKPFISLGLFWFFVSHSLESTFIPLELVHEHRNYLASFGIILVSVVGIIALLGNRQKFVLALFLLSIAFTGYMLSERSKIWSSKQSLLTYEAENHPNSAIANFQLGHYYYQQAMNGIEDVEQKAKKHLELSTGLDPYSILSELNLVVLSENKNINYERQWIIEAVNKIRAYPHIPSTQGALAAYLKCLTNGDCPQSLEDSKVLFEAANSTQFYRLSSVAAKYYTDVTNDYEKAKLAFKNSLHSRDATTWVNYLSFLLFRNELSEACSVYAKFVKSWENGRFKNSARFIDQASTLKENLGTCQI